MYLQVVSSKVNDSFLEWLCLEQGLLLWEACLAVGLFEARLECSSSGNGVLKHPVCLGGSPVIGQWLWLMVLHPRQPGMGKNPATAVQEVEQLTLGSQNCSKDLFYMHQEINMKLKLSLKG